jgi:hypothetical protein
MFATDLRNHIQELEAERMYPSLEGLSTDPIYMTDLADEIAAARNAYTGAAVTEIAVLRGQLSGRQVG